MVAMIQIGTSWPISCVATSCNPTFLLLQFFQILRQYLAATEQIQIGNRQQIQPATIRGNKSEAEQNPCYNDEVEVGGNDIQKGVRQTKSDSCQHLMDWIAIGKSSSNCFETKAEIETLWIPKGRN